MVTHTPRFDRSVPSPNGKGLLHRLDRLASPLFISCLPLLLLGIWEYRDLAVGDEAAYCNRAFPWLKGFSVDIAWSPLYTAFLGT